MRIIVILTIFCTSLQKSCSTSAIYNGITYAVERLKQEGDVGIAHLTNTKRSSLAEKTVIGRWNHHHIKKRKELAHMGLDKKTLFIR
ncbi:hypothetical protein [Guptibacillus algicola]|uniref:hypothetical protein n=1 Tax=Guptibacillus algicola TaxID=225844 RepID=UPI001CD75A89|nr:hypothetical protein [Alkalihalobacillus algicola]MCA0986715.1 hypothetical protein [Alkalihalobacillus algicola]